MYVASMLYALAVPHCLPHQELFQCRRAVFQAPLGPPWTWPTGWTGSGSALGTAQVQRLFLGLEHMLH